jgi:hypothetical protein
MKKTARRLIRIIMPVIAFVCFILFPPWDIVRIWLPPLPDSIHEQVDDAIDHGLDGIVVYVDRPGKAPAFYTAGWKNREKHIPADPHALFKIAGISKLYIAVTAAKLVATAQDVGIFLRALNDGTLLNDEEQAIYSSIYESGHTGLLPGYQSIARYHQELDAVVVQFVNTSGGNMWTISEIIYNRII